MPCGNGQPTAEDCAISCWSPAVDGRREGAGWRAPCPVCQIARTLEYGTRGSSIRWNSHCAHHDRDAVRPVLRGLVGPCMPGRPARGPAPVSHDDLASLALSGMPPTSLRLALLEMSGMGTRAALDKLGVRREHRSRVIAGRTNPGAKPQVRGCTNPGDS